MAENDGLLAQLEQAHAVLTIVSELSARHARLAAAEPTLGRAARRSAQAALDAMEAIATRVAAWADDLDDWRSAADVRAAERVQQADALLARLRAAAPAVDDAVLRQAIAEAFETPSAGADAAVVAIPVAQFELDEAADAPAQAVDEAAETFERPIVDEAAETFERLVAEAEPAAPDEPVADAQPVFEAAPEPTVEPEPDPAEQAVSDAAPVTEAAQSVDEAAASPEPEAAAAIEQAPAGEEPPAAEQAEPVGEAEVDLVPVIEQAEPAGEDEPEDEADYAPVAQADAENEDDADFSPLVEQAAAEPEPAADFVPLVEQAAAEPEEDADGDFAPLVEQAAAEPEEDADGDFAPLVEQAAAEPEEDADFAPLIEQVDAEPEPEPDADFTPLVEQADAEPEPEPEADFAPLIEQPEADADFAPLIEQAEPDAEAPSISQTEPEPAPEPDAAEPPFEPLFGDADETVEPVAADVVDAPAAAVDADETHEPQVEPPVPEEPATAAAPAAESSEFEALTADELDQAIGFAWPEESAPPAPAEADPPIAAIGLGAIGVGAAQTDSAAPEPPVDLDAVADVAPAVEPLFSEIAEGSDEIQAIALDDADVIEDTPDLAAQFDFALDDVTPLPAQPEQSAPEPVFDFDAPANDDLSTLQSKDMARVEFDTADPEPQPAVPDEADDDDDVVDVSMGSLGLMETSALSTDEVRAQLVRIRAEREAAVVDAETDPPPPLPTPIAAPAPDAGEPVEIEGSLDAPALVEVESGPMPVLDVRELLGEPRAEMSRADAAVRALLADPVHELAPAPAPDPEPQHLPAPATATADADDWLEATPTSLPPQSPPAEPELDDDADLDRTQALQAVDLSAAMEAVSAEAEWLDASQASSELLSSNQSLESLAVEDAADDPWAELDISAHGDLGTGRASKPRAPRADLDVNVGVEHAGNFFTAYSANISSEGVFVRCDHALAVGARADLFFEMPSGQSIAVQAEVTWSKTGNEGGMGLRFIGLRYDDRVVIDRFVTAQTR